MLIPFHEMPDFARLWIYQANRKLTFDEKSIIETGLRQLCEEWAAHGTPLKTSYKIEFNQFIILAVDERDAGASGCSIDSTVRLLQNLQKQIGIDFFDRQKIAFAKGEEVLLYPLSELKSLFESGILNGEGITFNNALTSKGEWEQMWQIPAKASWLSRYLPKSTGVQQPQ
jgi:hypothetical protein